MTYRKVTFSILSLISIAVLSGCSQSVSKETSPIPFTSERGGTAVYHYSPWFDVTKLPSDVQLNQLMWSYLIDERLYLTVFQPNMNFDIQLDPTKPVWTGVLKSDDWGKSWQKFFTVVNPKDATTNEAVRHNVAGIFKKDGALFLDVMDSRGGGSGEGQLTRLKSIDAGATWQKDGCFYFTPGIYFKDNQTFIQYFDVLQSGDTAPEKLEVSHSCAYTL